MRRICLLGLFIAVTLLGTKTVIAQVNLTVTITAGNSGTTCSDIGGGPEEHWQVEIAGQGYTTYPQSGSCFTNPSNIQYNETFFCPSDYPDSLQICFRALEDDGASCIVIPACQVQTCEWFTTPTIGNSYSDSIQILNNGVNASWGMAYFTITATGAFLNLNNDSICNAIGLGTLTFGGSIGDNTLSNYYNFCGTNTQDPIPSWTNNQGVWFEFTTGPNPSTLSTISAVSDPQNFGDNIDLQLAIYESSTNSCTGTLTLVQDSYNGSGLIYDESMDVSCLSPNTTYYILVDGEQTTVLGSNNGGLEGFFGLQVSDAGQVQAGDEICDAESFGLVPNGGSVSTTALSQSNICASNTNDPIINGMANNGVWYHFQAPASGSVTITASSDVPFPIGTDAIDLHIGIFESSNNLCSGSLTEVDNSYVPGIYDESLTNICLTPNQDYWVLIDGSNLNPTGIFDITIADANNTLVLAGDDICSGENLGLVPDGGSVGTASLSQTNTCASNTTDPTVNGSTYQGVWYEFQAPTSGNVTISAVSDNIFSNPVDIELSIFQSSNGTCTGTLSILDSSYTIGSNDETLGIGCLFPNQSYWVMVDGSMADPEGVFDITITDAGTMAAADSITDIQTACYSYTWIDGNTYTSSNNNASMIFTNSAGCDSIIVLDLTIFNETTSTEVITACDSYTWMDGITYTISNNTATDTLVNSNGCDSVITLDLTILNSTTGTDVITACNAYTWIDGNTYTTNNNTATFTLTNAAGCDSVVTLNLTINNSNTGTDVINTCNNHTWIDGNTYTTNNNTATFTLTNTAGCDSVVTLDLTIINDILNTEIIIACDSYTWTDGITYTASNTTATDTFPGVNGCDSIVTLDLTINNSTTSTDVITACDTYTWIDGNTYIANNNTATFTLTNALGCDSVITLDLTILNSTTGTDVITACNAHTWIDGNTYTTNNNTATFTLTNAAGCDSVVTLNLTINNSNTGTDIITACDTYTWIDGNTYIADNNTATFTLTNTAGCDSVVTLDLTIVNSNTGTAVITACDNYTWIDGNTYTANNNSATFTLANAEGCDSVVTLDLTILNSTSGTDVITTCNNYTWIDGNDYSSNNNTATHTLVNADGCDSVVTLDLTILSSSISTDVVKACDNYTWIDGNTYTSDNNTATYTLTNSAGCDSIIILDLTVNETMYGVDEIKAKDSYQWLNGITYLASNNEATYTFINGAANGCDSIVTLDLTIYHDEDIRLYVPNAFTPFDGGGTNSEWAFHVEGINIYNFQLQVFNRWGELVWECFDPDATWDGKYNNQYIKDDVYVWYIQFTGLHSDQTYQYSGFVTIIK